MSLMTNGRVGINDIVSRHENRGKTVRVNLQIPIERIGILSVEERYAMMQHWKKLGYKVEPADKI
jgi:hypothetical protein